MNTDDRIEKQVEFLYGKYYDDYFVSSSSGKNNSYVSNNSPYSIWSNGWLGSGGTVSFTSQFGQSGHAVYSINNYVDFISIAPGYGQFAGNLSSTINYSDGTSYSTNLNWNAAIYSNPNTSKLVNNVTVDVSYSFGSVSAVTPTIYLIDKNPKTITFTLPNCITNPSSANLQIFGNRQSGDNFTYGLIGLSGSVSNLQINANNSLSPLGAIQNLQIQITPRTNSMAWNETSLGSYLLILTQ
jgi:hypothetical protein